VHQVGTFTFIEIRMHGYTNLKPIIFIVFHRARSEHKLEFLHVINLIPNKWRLVKINRWKYKVAYTGLTKFIRFLRNVPELMGPYARCKCWRYSFQSRAVDRRLNTFTEVYVKTLSGLKCNLIFSQAFSRILPAPGTGNLFLTFQRRFMDPPLGLSRKKQPVIFVGCP
jgi:hypothetical protein